MSAADRCARPGCGHAEMIHSPKQCWDCDCKEFVKADDTEPVRLPVVTEDEGENE